MMFSCASAIASMVDFIGSVVTLVWYMVVLYGLWKLKDVRYEAPKRKYSRPEWDLLTEEEKRNINRNMMTVYIKDM